jgi:hypothetical protein
MEKKYKKEQNIMNMNQVPQFRGRGSDNSLDAKNLA